MLAHENTLTHKRDIRNPLTGLLLGQSGEMPKLPVKNILAKNLFALRTAHETLNTYKRVGEAAGLSGSTVERIEKMQSEARIENVEALARTFSVDVAAMLSEDLRPRTQKSGGEVEISQFLEAGGSMGRGILLRDQPGEIHSWRVTPEWIEKNVRSHTGIQNLAIVTGFGDSMRGMFNPGDPLLVDRGVRAVEFDAVYFFRVGDEGFIKRLQRIPGEGLVAISENKAYRDWTIKKDMDFEVFARVIKVWSSEDF